MGIEMNETQLWISLNEGVHKRKCDSMISADEEWTNTFLQNNVINEMVCFGKKVANSLYVQS